jgi:DNA invertase Pin-like site-specific DNA recombinase
MRFSSAEQAKGDSLERQRSLAVEYIARHPQQEIVLAEDLQFVDEGVSSYTGQNLQPGRALRRFLECVEDGRVASGSILMVESLDRLSRQQVIQAQRLLLDILLSGITVITTSPAESRAYDGRSGLQDLIISLAGMERANRESAIKSDRVRRAWKRKKENASTTKLTSRAPSWLKLNPDRKSFSVVEEKAAVVRRIFELAETLGQASIVRILNNEGVPPLMKGATGWHESSVTKVLTSPAVHGVYQPHERDKTEGKTRRVPDGAAVEAYYPSIVDKDIFYRIQALRSTRKTAGAGRKGLTYTNIFGGIAKCAHCGSSMAVVDKGALPKGGQYFVCSSARRGVGCQYRSVRYS